MKFHILCFDTSNDTLQLDFLFKFVRDNLDLFSVEAYKKCLLERGTSPEDCEHWAKRHISITEKIVDEDAKRIRNLPITNIKRWRNKKLAHLDEQLTRKNIDIMKDYPVTVREIDDIIDTIHEILDRYRVSFDGISWKLGLPDTENQLDYIMDALQSHRESRKASRKNKAV